MKVKLDDYEIDILINGLFQQRSDYDAQTNRAIDDLLFQMVQKVKHKKLCRRQKFRFESQETRLIRMCLIQWAKPTATGSKARSRRGHRRNNNSIYLLKERTVVTRQSFLRAVIKKLKSRVSSGRRENRFSARTLSED